MVVGTLPKSARSAPRYRSAGGFAILFYTWVPVAHTSQHRSLSLSSSLPAQHVPHTKPPSVDWMGEGGVGVGGAGGRVGQDTFRKGARAQW